VPMLQILLREKKCNIDYPDTVGWDFWNFLILGISTIF
jgi:hypothetical protein